MIETSTSVSTLSTPQTVTSMQTSQFAGRLPPTNGTTACVFDHYSLPALRQGQVIEYSLVSLSPIDLVILPEGSFSTWTVGAQCGQVANPIVEQLGVTVVPSGNFTVPATGDYEIIAENRSNNSTVDYVITIDYQVSMVERSSASTFFVTQPLTFTTSLPYLYAVPTPIYHNSLVDQIIANIPIIVVLVFLLAAADIFRRWIGKKKKPVVAGEPGVMSKSAQGRA
ncbi:MAG TPA: hypothetical protein VEG61_00520 [Candidatus Dormibacteraeota bacterium]|nr:hypothetical protein [Candidatus Dormibacteraeota bacterium]